MEKYLDPEMEIVEFEAKDIITTSAPNWKPDGNPDGNPDGGFGWEEEEEEPW